MQMKIAVRYVTRSGNTKKLAEAIGKAVEASALPVTDALAEPVDLLFLGGSVYAGGVDPALSAFIGDLKAGYVKKAAVFSTAAIARSAYPQIKKLLEAKGIEAVEQEYHCRGKFLCLHMNRPNEKDCAAAAQFAQGLKKEFGPKLG
jgi:flavodoxin